MWRSTRIFLSSGFAVALIAVMSASGCSEADGEGLRPFEDVGGEVDSPDAASGPEVDGSEAPDGDEPNTDGDVYSYEVLASEITEFTVEVGPCCDGDGDAEDNHFGSLVDTLALFMNEEQGRGFDPTVGAGALTTAGLAWPHLVDPSDDSVSVEVHFLNLVDVGNHEFDVSQSSFSRGVQPLFALAGGTLSGGALTVGPGTFPFVLPLGFARLPLEARGSALAGELELDGIGVALKRGMVSGAVPLEVLRDRINGYLLSSPCGCLELEGPIYERIGSCAAATVDATRCTLAAEQSCVTLATSCPVIGPLLELEADVDLDGDDVDDALSAFFAFEAAGARLRGPVHED